MIRKLASMAVTVRVEDASAFVRAAQQAGWSAVDSGERVRNDAGVEKEAVLLVRIPDDPPASA